MIDFTECATRKKAYNGANGTKMCIIYNDELYMLKMPMHPTKKTNLSYVNGCISEYIGCHIYDMLGIPVQETVLGTYNYHGVLRQAVACKDFTSPGIILMDFASLKNQVVDSATGGTNTELSEVLYAIDNQNSMDSGVVLHRFWDMFVVDALLGNFNRHNGNWGFLYNTYTDEIALAPVYDCGSCLYPQADREIIRTILNDTGERHTRIYNFPASALKMDGKKILYYDFLTSVSDRECLQAILRIYPRIDMKQIQAFVENIDCIDDLQKEFYSTMLSERCNLILKPAYERAVKLSGVVSM